MSDAQADYSAYWSQFDSDGWTFGNNASSQNISSGTFVGWCWRANGGTTASNSDGSITSTVQANTAAGFSIITYTGTGSNANFGHGLSATPEFIIVKNRGTSDDWMVYHTSVGATKYLKLNTSEAEQSNSAVWNAEPTTSLINVGNLAVSNGSSANYICYAWHGS